MRRLVFILSLFISLPLAIMAQQEPFDDMLKEKVIIDDPVYKPVISFGTGVLNFHGDVKNNYFQPVLGDNAYKFNVSTYIDRGRFFKANFFFIYGSMTGNYRSYIDINRNLNFKTDIINFGINAEYSFLHFTNQRNRLISPFLSVGIGNIQFTSKGDLFDNYGNPYNYWSDGTIRDIPESEALDRQSQVIHRNYVYETDLRKWEKDNYGLGNYGRYAFSFPVDIGVDFNISQRVSCRLGTSMHFTLTDYLDNVSSSGTYHKGSGRNDWFTFSYFSIHLDLFSQPKEQFVDRLFLELEFDDIMFGDDDGDFVLNIIDECPGTPPGVIVDAVGCPIDSDGDGVPDYLDLEPNTPKGNWVDEDGVTLTMEEFMEKMKAREEAMSRDELQAYLNTISKGYTRSHSVEIPDKFKRLDRDNDGYISFDELLEAIDDFFDLRLNLSVEEMYELNHFFFTQ